MSGRVSLRREVGEEKMTGISMVLAGQDIREKPKDRNGQDLKEDKIQEWSINGTGYEIDRNGEQKEQDIRGRTTYSNVV
jgi:hypothetical protein